ncbi:MAG: SurA N-terminal domain-containing protein, partial [Planctomycetota bacterium]
MAREERPNASAPARRINPFGPDAMRRWYLAGAATLVVVASLVARGAIGGGEAHGRSPDAGSVSGGSHRPPPADLPAGGPKHDVMAIVNGRDISRQTLAQACVERYGEEVLESLVNKRLIEHHCRKRGVRVTTAEIDAEIDRMSDRFKLGRKQWLELLKNQRGVDEAEYRRDILWPTVALRKLARDEIEPTDAELRRAHESRFGPSVRARLIAVGDAPLAERVRAQAIADPSRFPRLAMEHSKDVGSASLGGLIQPIRMHAGDPELERVAFSLEPGEVSPVVATAGQHVILLCEGKLPSRNVTFGEVRDELAATVSEGKLRGVADKLFARLQSSATVKNIYNDADLRQTMAGVVATVNGDRVTMKELGQECLARHGEEVLEVEISQMLLRQAIEGAGLAVTQDDLRSEMLHAAELAGVLDATGNPDLKQWIAAATEQQGVDYERYVRDSVWPSAALKKLTSA